MLKTSRKPLLVVALLLCIAGVSLAAYGMFWVTSSNTVHVDVQYTVDLSSSVSGSNVTLDALVRRNGAPIAGIGVDFYYSVNSGVNWTYFATQTTAASGIAQAIYTITANGGYDFEAIATIP
jgi:hypothetical protein